VTTRLLVKCLACKDPFVAEDSEQRIAGNEAVFRRVNETIEHGKAPLEAGTLLAFRCECARLGCNDLVELTVADYERVRAHPRRFLLAIGHESSEIETVVDTHPGYEVVEKREEAAHEAEETDPRD
jgi:hypothetical protein